MGNKLVFADQSYEGEIVASGGRFELSHAMVGETLAIDSLSLSLKESIRLFLTADDEVLCASGDEVFAAMGSTLPVPSFTALAPGMYYFDDDLIGNFYETEQHKRGNKYELKFVSAISLLGRSYHAGGLYVGTLAGTIIADIMGTVSYSVDDNLASIQVFGYLPYAIRRDNLQKLLMAVGGAIRNMPDGTLRITSLSEISTGSFDVSRVFKGGSVLDETPVTAVQVTEHNYIETTEEVTLFDGASVSVETIKFTEPIHDLTITGGTIDASGVNFCTFTGAGSVLLKGQKYQHVTRVITEGTVPTGSPDDVVTSVPDNTLLTPNNASEVAERLYNYLTVAQSIKAKVVFGTERPGDVVSVMHPDTKELVTATIKKMDVDIGATELRANTEFLVGYIPPSLITGFEHYAVLTGSGTWVPPAGVDKARAILCGAGNGGLLGSKGQNGGTVYGGSGGDPAQGGEGGLILEINIDVTPEEGITYACGIGGDPSTAGGETIFGALSSTMGRVYPYGYTEPKSAITFGTKGIVGLKGGSARSYTAGGPSGGTVYYKGVLYVQGENGDNYYSEHVGNVYGGLGGGPAAGVNGLNATDGDDTYYNGSWVASGGRGGNGANAVANDDAVGYGEGGPGGHGGGGGGASKSYPVFSGPGIGGNGGLGGRGGPGIIIVYY